MKRQATDWKEISKNICMIKDLYRLYKTLIITQKENNSIKIDEKMKG